MAQFDFKVLASIADADRAAWQRIFDGAAEGYDYLLACEHAPPPSFEYAAVAVFDGDRLVAGSPVFLTHFDAGMFLDGTAGRIFNGITSVVPSLGRVPMVGFGSPHTQEPTLAFDPALSPSEHKAAFATLLDGVDQFAADNGARLVVAKDVSQDTQSWANDLFTDGGYARVTALPVALMDVPKSEEAYIADLSGNMRSNLRRRLKRARNVRVEIRDNCEGLTDQLYALREATLQRGSNDFAHFAATSRQFYPEVLERLPGRAKLLTYWLGDRLIAFSLVVLGPTRLVQNYNGMCYPEGPDNGVFYLDWMTQIRLCMEHGIKELQSGVTTYLIKARLGSRFHRRYFYIRHRYRSVNTIVRSLSAGVSLEKDDPGLQELGDNAPFV